MKLSIHCKCDNLICFTAVGNWTIDLKMTTFTCECGEIYHCCTRCGEIKPFSDFGKDVSRKRRRTSDCKLCIQKRVETHTTKNKGSYKEYQKKYQKEYRSRPEVKERKRLYAKEYYRKRKVESWK